MPGLEDRKDWRDTSFDCLAVSFDFGFADDLASKLMFATEVSQRNENWR
jgi:hypothetical protein